MNIFAVKMQQRFLCKEGTKQTVLFEEHLGVCSRIFYKSFVETVMTSAVSCLKYHRN